jgi:phosphoribosylformylglycinamidine cyclo-ligase
VDNIPRVLPKTCDVIIRKSAWERPPIFRLLEAAGTVPEAEQYQVFNMGIGMTLIVAADRAAAVMRAVKAHGQAAWCIGEVVRGQGVVRMVD